MERSKNKLAKLDLKEKAFYEFNEGKHTQRELADKYDICETELSRFFTLKYKLSGYPQLNHK